METRPTPEEATDARGIREAPAVTALRRQPRLSDLIDRADDLRKRDKGE